MKILAFLILFSLVVFIHELGHFLFARLFGVKVISFSLGFGKKLVSFTRGETEYKISMIPFGGYVKMLGEGDDSDSDFDEKEKSFRYKKWWQKNLIVFAGPFFNILFAFVIYFIVAFFNFYSVAPIVEDVTLDSPAFKAGIHEGDIIRNVGGKPADNVHVWEDISAGLPSADAGCGSVEVTVDRNGKEHIFKVDTAEKTFKNVFQEDQKVCLLGISAMPKEPIIALKAPMEQLSNGDMILAVDGKPVNRYYELEGLLSSDFKTLSVAHYGDTSKTEQVTLSDEEKAFLIRNIVYGGLVVKSVESGSVSDSIGIKKGDFIVSVDNLTVSTPYDFREKILKREKGADIKLFIYRDGMPSIFSFTLDKNKEQDKYTGLENTTFKWGADFVYNYAADSEKSLRGNRLTFPFRYSVEKTGEMFYLTVKGIFYLITGKLSPKGIGGPIMIFDISSRAAEMGFAVFLAVMGMISINLGIINLFPLPILDGGHIVMYTLEGLLRREISSKIKQILATAGFVFLILLTFFALFNDINRYFAVFSG